LEKVTFYGAVKNVTVSNAKGTYILGCNNSDFEYCLTPTPGKDYLLFNKTTKWKFSGAKDYTTLDFLQSVSGKYTKKNKENIALLPSGGNEVGTLGMYWLVSWNKK